MRVWEYAVGELRGGFVSLSSGSSSSSSSSRGELQSRAGLAWFVGSYREKKEVEREWGTHPCGGVGELPQHARRFESSAVETGQKLTASQPARASSNWRFSDPGQHGPITSGRRPPWLPIRTVRATQTSARAVPDLQLEVLPLLALTLTHLGLASWGQTTTFGGEPSAALILPVHPTKNLHNISPARPPHPHLHQHPRRPARTHARTRSDP